MRAIKILVGRRFITMLILGLAIGAISIDLTYLSTFNNAFARLTYIAWYVVTFSISLILLSFLLGTILQPLCRFLTKENTPKIRQLAWRIWIIIATIFLLNFIYHHHLKSQYNRDIQGQNTAKNVYKNVNHSIYSVYSKDKNNKDLASGGAVAVSDTLLATNCHVIEDGDHFTVTIANKEHVGQVFSQHGDLCIIKVGNHKFSPTEIRPSKSVDIGEDVFAIGNPEGFEKSISKGIISNKYDDEGITILQTDAAISPGSSGGGLFDHDGKLIGITTVKLIEAHDEGIGFVIPTETIQAAILEPTKYRKTPPTTDRNQEYRSDKSEPKLNLIGKYGESQIELFKLDDFCIFKMPGRSDKGEIRSLIFWSPFKPSIFFIFPSTTKIKEANNVLLDYFSKDDDQVLTQNYLVLNNTPYQLSGNKSTVDNYNVLSVTIDKNPIKLFIDAEYFIVLFTDKSTDTGYSTDYYNLNGFSEALAEYHGHCENVD